MMHRFSLKIQQNKLFLNFKLNYLPLSCSYHSKYGAYGHRPDASPKYNTQYEVNAKTLKRRHENANLYNYINAYREYGHLKANINPLFPNERHVGELDPSFHGVALSNERVSTEGLFSGHEATMTFTELEERLKQVYCGELSAEFMYLPTLEEREWFAQEFETTSTHSLSSEEKKVIATDLLKSQVWDNFMAVKFQSVKRYGAEGAESMMTLFREAFRELSKDGAEELIFGMSHRGRLNLLTGLLEVGPEALFNKLKGFSEFPSNYQSGGDVISHFICSVDLDMGQSKPLHVSMLYNPSHLEALNPVICGKSRGRQRRLGDGHYAPQGEDVSVTKVASLQVHGDAAISGQGIVQETLNLAEVPNFGVGGSLHFVINNQIGYTTPDKRGRSSMYCTDIAKMCLFPVIHANGDHPEAVLKAARVAVAYNRKFRRDVFVDLVCWRRWGHNELDNPRFTNPEMYKIIDARRSVPDSYAAKIIEEGVMSEEEKAAVVSSHSKFLGETLKKVDSYKPPKSHLLKHWSEMVDAPDSIEIWDTGVDTDLLKYLGSKSVELPENFVVNPHLKKTHIAARLEKLTTGKNLDWATGEILAIASLLHQGYDVRLCGQDVGRGTFSQRHAMFVDQETDELVVPLNGALPSQSGSLEIANSILSEEAVIGFEYGVSIDSPQILCLWEAQFGDFFNGAQIILDTFLSSGEEKWLTQSGLVLLLPHGFDGAGPEHSSCRLERFLQMSNSRETKPDSERVNWNVIFPSNSAQIFHALRRQMVRNFRKPLVVVGPKAILRLPAAYSALQDMAPGTYFLPVIGDPDVKEDDVKKVVFVSGKHYYLLKGEREKLNLKDVALIRLESLCPFPTQEINRELSKYKKAKSFVWSQEEHRNMGAWSFVSPRFRNLCGTQLTYAGREELASVAVGIEKMHKQQVEDIVKQTFGS